MDIEESKRKAGERTARWRKNNPDYLERQRKNRQDNLEKYQLNARKRYEKNKSKISIQTIKRYDKLRNEVLTGYSKGIPKCSCCRIGGNSFLAIDHIAGRKQMDSEPELVKLGYSSKLVSVALYNWLVKNNFPKEFQILCHNCNYAKFQLGKCPHEAERLEQTCD
jgi:hypothetical protein